MELLNKVKIALRVDTDVFDDEINLLIEAAKLDLKTSGVEPDLTDSIVNTAIVFYVKSNFGYDNLDSGKFLRSYNGIKHKLRNHSNYQIGDDK